MVSTTKMSSNGASAISTLKRDLIRLICSGHSTKEAAKIMRIPLKIAEAHRKSAMAKLGLNNAVKLAHWAIANNLLEPETASNGANALSAREREFVRLICGGCSTREAAKVMNISATTAETHRENVMEKLRLHRVVKLTHWAIANGLVEIMKFGEAPNNQKSAAF